MSSGVGRWEILKARYRACLLGALAGDCLGARYERFWPPFLPRTEVEDYVRNVAPAESAVLSYTDDTALLRPLARHLIKHRGSVNARELSKKFADTYVSGPRRGYGKGVRMIFETCSDGFAVHGDAFDFLEPARSTFGGKGSFGNGAAMRAAPCALACASDWNRARAAAILQAQLRTHHPDGVMGAVVMTRAVFLAVNLKQGSGARHRDAFIPQIADILGPSSEGSAERWSAELGNLLALKDDWTQKYGKANYDADDEAAAVAKTLGHDVSALKSVPSAIYSFLRSWEKDLGALGAVEFALQIGGDTDTIATMAGSIAGAFFGAVPDEWPRMCEGSAYAEGLACDLVRVAYPSSKT